MRLLTALLLLAAAPAFAASIESLVMPGPVVTGHAELEDECGNCHAPFSKASQSSLCLDCHDAVAADLTHREGFHGTGGRLAGRECRSCHTEHLGRDADIVGLVPEAFDHTLTGFELTGRHTALACRNCHRADQPYREVPAQCAGCHDTDDPHRGNLGNDCQACHDTAGWLEHGFDHDAETGFALRGGHTGLACESCHAGQSYRETPTRCASCHVLDDVHDGSRGSDCAACHDEDDWQETRFDHLASTGFALEGAHGTVACAGCHLTDMTLEAPPTDCNGCHSVNDVHQGRRGTDCGSCHRQSSWQVSFDHGRRTGFSLQGSHGELACDACHRGALDDPLPTECEGCHRSDDPHGGALPSCTDCHEPASWSSPLRFDHEFTSFPLLGLHRLATCAQCHASLDFHDTGAACRDCHAADDVHDGALGQTCETCHNPSGWNLWHFDHDNRTDFPLSGAHADLACAGCHPPGRTEPLGAAGDCAGCHQADDVHNGQFGQNCGRCHTSDTFAEPRRMF